MQPIAELFYLIIGIVSIIAVIVFFVMGSNLGTLVKLNRAQVEQNKQIIAYLKKQSGEEEKPKDEFASYKKT